MSELQIEQEIQAKGLNAPRVTPALIDSKIKGKTFTILPNKRTMVCQLTLENGFTVEGNSAVVDVANFDQEVGETISFKNARDQIWQLEGYLLKQRLFEDRQISYIENPTKEQAEEIRKLVNEFWTPKQIHNAE